MGSKHTTYQGCYRWCNSHIDPGVVGQQMDNTVTTLPSLTAITDSPPQRKMFCIEWIWVLVYQCILEVAGQQKRRRRVPHHLLMEQDPGPWKVPRPVNRGTKLHKTGSKHTTHHESFMGWQSSEETMLRCFAIPLCQFRNPLLLWYTTDQCWYGTKICQWMEL